jgi:hypothetical protein
MTLLVFYACRGQEEISSDLVEINSQVFPGNDCLSSASLYDNALAGEI